MTSIIGESRKFLVYIFRGSLFLLDRGMAFLSLVRGDMAIREGINRGLNFFEIVSIYRKFNNLYAEI